MTTLPQAVADLIAAPRPILFLDTCTLFDIVRAPLRDLTVAVRAGVELRALAAAGTVRLFVQDIVPGEWADNLSAARRAWLASGRSPQPGKSPPTSGSRPRPFRYSHPEP